MNEKCALVPLPARDVLLQDCPPVAPGSIHRMKGFFLYSLVHLLNFEM